MGAGRARTVAAGVPAAGGNRPRSPPMAANDRHGSEGFDRRHTEIRVNQSEMEFRKVETGTEIEIDEATAEFITLYWDD
jgi:hypothetical protein